MKVGKSKFGGKRNVFKIEDGDNVFRILPPLGSLADSGNWSVYYAVQWGFKDSQGKLKPFEDCRVVNKSGMVEVESPAYLLRQKLQSEKESLVDTFSKQLKAGELTQEQVKEKLKPINEKIKRFNLDAKHYLNVVNLKGEIGLLKINNTLMKSLRAAIKKQNDRGVDPTSVEHGVYFSFNRSNETGKIQDYVFSVTPYLENQGDGSFREKIHVMDDAFMSRLDNEATDLSKLYKKPTPEEIQEMIDTGATEKGSSAVDRILGSNNNQSQTTSNGGEDVVEAKSEGNSGTVSTANTSDTKVETKEEVDNTKVETKEPEKKESNQVNTDLDDDEFLKSLGAEVGVQSN